ncbi:MAG TPA: TlyA family RNA methyltransferase [Euzebya sp.]|nr:TlyA family RNA methyltransferase [Euzebya sp.]
MAGAAARRARLDAEMVRRRLAPSRSAAQGLIAAGEVTVQGIAQPRAASQVTPGQHIEIVSTAPRFASRGGLKLSGALDDLAVDPTGLLALDAGAAHGGFTDVLLRRGAAHVIAVDVAYGQLAWHLRTDERVTLLERTNVRHLTSGALGGRRPELVVADLSFISLGKVLPALAAVTSEDAALLPMVKPQFEAGPTRVGKGGVVRDPTVWAEACHAVIASAAQLGFTLHGVVPSQAPGPAGNIEFFLLLRRGIAGAAGDPSALIADATAAGQALAGR